MKTPWIWVLIAIAAPGVGCQGAGRPRLAIGEAPDHPRVVGWRLVERTYGTTDAGHAGDGEIPGDQRTLIYQPLFEESAGAIHDCGGVQFRSACPHSLEVTLRGGLHHSVDSRVVAEGRIASPPGIYHELAIEPQSSQIEILEVKGAVETGGKQARYFVEGPSSFEIVFTSHSPGTSGLLLTVVREVGRPYVPRDARVAEAPRLSVGEIEK